MATGHRGHRVYRSLVHLYPRSFRGHYGDDLVQQFADLVADRGVPAAWARTGVDLLVTVPRYRLESIMSDRRSVVVIRAAVVILAAVGIVSVLAGFLPGAILVVAAAVLAVTERGKLARSIRTPDDGGRRPWLAAGAVALGAAVAIPVIDGGEVSQSWWCVMAALGLLGIGLVLTGLLAVFSQRTAQQARP